MHVYHTSISSLFVYTYKCFSFNKAYKKRKLAKQLKNINARVLDKNILGYKLGCLKIRKYDLILEIVERSI